MFSSYNWQSVQGPTDPILRRSEVEGYQPVSRIGEVVLNAFVDAYEWQRLPESLQEYELNGKTTDPAVPGAADKPAERKPHFHEWATVTPGMICLQRKHRRDTFRNYVAAETAAPVISSCACLKYEDEIQYFFAGVGRSKVIREINDGNGSSVDEYFTMAIGGLVTLLNNSDGIIAPGDIVEWTFVSNRDVSVSTARGLNGPRRVAVKVADALSDKVIGTSKGFAKQGETFDLLLRQC